MKEFKVVSGGKNRARLNGYDVINNKGTSILFISPENSYYSEENIYGQIKCSDNLFSKLYVLIPQGPLVHNYLAEGYSEIVANRKARLKCNNLRNKVQRGLDDLVEANLKTNIINWEKDVEENEKYKNELIKFNKLYIEDNVFRADVINATKTVLEKKIKNISSNNLNSNSCNFEEGGKYVLEELAFMVAAPSILNESELTFTYHRDWSIFEKYVEGKYLKIEEQKLGLVIIN
ncbi:MAG: tRNA-dependent cyclodipeptide synthase [Candidatus Woesearchaeota archaeon]|jgi:tRNA-dependent cyclodipeptide synthase